MARNVFINCISGSQVRHPCVSNKFDTRRINADSDNGDILRNSIKCNIRLIALGPYVHLFIVHVLHRVSVSMVDARWSRTKGVVLCGTSTSKSLTRGVPETIVLSAAEWNLYGTGKLPTIVFVCPTSNAAVSMACCGCVEYGGKDDFFVNIQLLTVVAAVL